MKQTHHLKKLLFKLYIRFPLNKPIYSLWKMVSVPPYRLRKLLRFYGSFRLRLSSDNEIKMVSYGNTIENELFWLGLSGWEKSSIEVWIMLCKNSQIIFDIGANTGLYSLAAKKINKNSQVYAFEPIPIIFKRLRKNFKLNKVDIQAFEVAIADDEGKDKIFVAETVSDTFDQASLNPGKTHHQRRLEIPILKRKLVNIIEQENLKSIDLMKIDVETFEPQVLMGMERYLKLFQPTILIEILNDHVALEVTRLIAGLNYSLFEIREEGCIRIRTLLSERKGNNFLLLNPTRHPDVKFD